MAPSEGQPKREVFKFTRIHLYGQILMFYKGNAGERQ
jgi:hypothetical protein